jgi:hypothetical protein
MVVGAAIMAVVAATATDMKLDTRVMAQVAAAHLM